MKRIINLNISKDTPEETLAALNAALKTGKEKSFLKVSELYVLNEDIEKLHERYEQLFKQVKTSLNLSETQIQKECETLSLKYDFEIKELSKMRKVDYDKRQAEIKAREAEERPWRRCWLWRLLFMPLTNRAQDIIEERAELDADVAHSAAEKQLDEDWRKFFPDTEKKLTKRERRRLIREKLQEVIKQADEKPTNEAFDEPAGVPALDVAATEPAQPLPPRRPRPPRSCRRSAT